MRRDMARAVNSSANEWVRYTPQDLVPNSPSWLSNGNVDFAKANSVKITTAAYKMSIRVSLGDSH